MATPGLERMQWDPLPVADTRPAMKGGVPFWLIFPIFFGPCILVVITFKIWLMLAIPVLWFGSAACFAGNHNRPFEWAIYFVSGAAFANWRPWGGVSCDPHGSPDDKAVFL